MSGCIGKYLINFARFASLAAGVLVFVVPSVMAQQASSENGQLAADLFDDPASLSAPVVRPNEPQDPLNEVYANRSSQTADARLNERLNRPINNALVGPLRDPLRQLPRDFRDDRFVYELARQQRLRLNRLEGDSWRTRDDTAFDPLGVPVGSFVFYPEIYSQLVATNNLFATRNNRKSDYSLEVTPSFRLRSDWNVHELELFGSLTDKRWRHFASENTTEAETRVRARIDITARTSVEGGARYELRSEGRGSSELPDAASEPAKTHETEVFAQIDHRFNRLGFRLRGQVIRNVFEDVGLNNGGTQNNHIRDYDESRLSLRSNYEFSPRFSLFADNEIGKRVFENAIDDNGFLQGSKSWLAAVGASIEFTPTLNFLGRVGYAKADTVDPRITDLQGVIYDAQLIWTPTSTITATLTGQTEIEETTQSGSSGSINRSVAFELVNSWTYRLSSTLSSQFEMRDYEGIVQLDEELTIGFGVEYLVSRSWALDVNYKHTQVEGSNTYREDELRLGLKWRR